MQEVLGINNFPIIEDDRYYYFFRALNNGDNNDIENGITASKGTITSIRTDRARFQGQPRYTQDSSISLQEAYDHIKIHNSKDTNCISLSTTASTVLDYGRESYNDTYVLIKVPKKELGKTVFNAGTYMLEEITELIEAYLSTNQVPQEVLDYLNKIEQATTQEELNKINSSIYLSDIEIDLSPSLKQNIQYKVTEIRSMDYQSLTDDQNLEKNKIAAKMQLLQKKGLLTNILPGVSNGFLLSTIGSAFSSTEFLHYQEISQEKITKVPSALMDIFAALEQLPLEYKDEINKIKMELINQIKRGTIDLEEFPYNSISIPNQLSIEKLYNLSGGKLSYYETKNLYSDIFYLAKSKLRNQTVLSNLKRILGNNSEYNKIFDYIGSNTYGIEPELINRQSGNGLRLTSNTNLYLKSKNTDLLELISTLSPLELTHILNNSNDIVKNIIDNLSLKSTPQDKETYYLNAIIDTFNWDKLGIQDLSPESREDLIIRLKETQSIDLYNILSKENFSDEEISTIILTCIIKKKRLLDYQENEVFNVTELESFLGYYRVNGSNIKLKDYQGIALKKINKTLSTHNFSTCVLPTGAGKTFVALAKMLENPNQEMLYLAPSDEILEQVKSYVVEYIYGKSVTKSKNEILKEVFPNLTLATYPTLISRRGHEIISKQYDFILLDELHRTGAPKWYEPLEKMLTNQDHAKVLGITATPERDVDSKDMSNEIARIMGYTEEEIKNKEHISYYMDLFEAISLGYVVNPKVVECEYTLEESGYIENILEKLSFIKDEETRKKLLLKLDELRRRLNESTGIDEILKQNIKQGGRYIVFIPSSGITEMFDTEEEKVKFEKLTGEDKIIYYQKKLMEYLKNSGLDCCYYSMLGDYSQIENRTNLREFESDTIDSGKTKFMIVIDKLNEGVHVNNIDGLIWFRALDENSKILFLQQLGRIIYSIDPSQEFPDEKRPIAIDLANNAFRVDLNKTKRAYSKKTDYDLLSVIIDWSEMHGNKIPSINSEDRVESRYGAILRRIKNKYEIYAHNQQEIFKNSLEEIEDIKRILILGEQLDLWNIVLEERLTKEEVTAEIDIDLFNIKGVLRDLYELDNTTTYLTTDVKARLYIEFLVNNPDYEIRRVDKKDNVFPGTTIKIRAFLGRKENVDRILKLIEEEKYLSPQYEQARLSFNGWVINFHPEVKVDLYIEFLVNNPNYKIKNLEEKEVFPNTNVKIWQFWASKKKVIRETIMSPKYLDPRYDHAKEMIETWFKKSESRTPVVRRITERTKERISAERKARLYIRFLLENPDYQMQMRDELNCYPETNILIADFWTKKNHRKLTRELLNREEYADPKYDIVREKVFKWIKLNDEKHDPKFKVTSYIQFLLEHEEYIPDLTEYDYCFPGSELKIGSFWSNEKYRKEVEETLSSPEYADKKYDSVRERIIIWKEQMDTRLNHPNKTKLFIDFLLQNKDYELNTNYEKSYFPGTKIEIGFFWKNNENRDAVQRLLDEKEYFAPKYDFIRHKVEKYIKEYEERESILSRYDATKLFIEFLLQNPNFVLNTNYQTVCFPGTEIEIGFFWKYKENRDAVQRLLDSQEYFDPKYDYVRDMIENYMLKNEQIDRVHLFIKLLNSGYIPETNDTKGTVFPGTDIEVNRYWSYIKCRERIIKALQEDPKYQTGYEVAQAFLANFLYQKENPKRVISSSTKQKIELYIELLNTTDYIPQNIDKKGTKFPGTDIEIKQFWKSLELRAIIFEEFYTNPKYKVGYERARAKLDKLKSKKENEVPLEDRIDLYIELLNTTSYVPINQDYSGTKFPGLELEIKFFWQNHEDKIIKRLFTNPKFANGYEVAKEKINKHQKLSESIKASRDIPPKEQCRLYIELLNTTDYYPSASSPENQTITFPGTNVTIKSFWGIEDRRELVFQLLTSDKKYETGYEKAKEKVFSAMKRRESNMPPEEKAGLYIELLNTTNYIPVRTDAKDTCFPTTRVKVGSYLNYEPNLNRVLDMLSNDPKYQTGYELAKTKMNNYLNRNEESLSTEEKIILLIELINNGFIPINQVSSDITFPGTTISINGFWKSQSVRDRVNKLLFNETKYEHGYEIAKLIIGIKNSIAEKKLGNVEGPIYMKSTILSLCSTSEAARIVATYNGWLSLEEAKISFDDMSSFAKAKQNLLETKEKKKK